jgi:hypothetical protein
MKFVKGTVYSGYTIKYSLYPDNIHEKDGFKDSAIKEYSSPNGKACFSISFRINISEKNAIKKILTINNQSFRVLFFIIFLIYELL